MESDPAMIRPLHRSARLVLCLGAAAVALLAASCAESAKEPRLVILYAPCSVNKHYLSPYDGTVPFTPNLDAFAREGLVFERHNNEAGQSGVDYAAIFCGVQADRHGVFCHPKSLDKKLYQVSEAFALAGYETFFWSGQKMGAWDIGYGQGVARKNAYIREHTDLDSYTANDAQFAAILDKLEADPDYKAFVQINFTVTHNPYQNTVTAKQLNDFVKRFPGQGPGVTNQELNHYIEIYAANRLPLEWDYAKRADALGLTPEDRDKLARTLEFFYKVRVYQLDTLFGKLMDTIRARGLLDDSVVSFTADHGEILYRDNAIFAWTHGNQLAPEVLDVPWIVRAPAFGVDPGRYGSVTRSIDVFPTLCGLAGIEVSSSLVDGTDLSAAMRGKAEPPHLLAYSHTTTIDKRYDHLHQGTLLRALNPRDDPTLIWVRVRDGDMVYQHRYLGQGHFRYEVFDLATDPEERENLFDPENPTHREMVARLQAYRRRLVDGYFAHNAGELSREEADRRLRDLGYIGSADD